MSRRREFQDGRETVRELYARVAFKGCVCGIGGCTGHPILQARTFWPLDELMKRDRAFAIMSRLKPQAIQANLVAFQGSDGQAVTYVRHTTVYACEKHAKELEQASAKAPSWCVVEFQRGPADAPIMTGWSTELANAHSVAPKRSDEPEVRITDRRHSAVQA